MENKMQHDIYYAYCPFYKDCLDGSWCPRSLRKDIADNARTGHALLRYSKKPECFHETKIIPEGVICTRK